MQMEEREYTAAGFVPLLGLLGAILAGAAAWWALDGLRIPGFELEPWLRWLATGLAALTGLCYFGLPSTLVNVPDWRPHLFQPRDLTLALGKLVLLAWLYLGLPWVVSWFSGGWQSLLDTFANLGRSSGGWNVLWDLAELGLAAQTALFLLLLPVIYLGANALLGFLSAFDADVPWWGKLLLLPLCGALTLGLGLGGLLLLGYTAILNLLGSLGLILILLVFGGVTAGLTAALWQLVKPRPEPL